MMDTFNRQIDFGIPSGGHIHMIGIGGASMSGLATLLLQMGWNCFMTMDIIRKRSEMPSP